MLARRVWAASFSVALVPNWSRASAMNAIYQLFCQLGAPVLHPAPHGDMISQKLPDFSAACQATCACCCCRQGNARVPLQWHDFSWVPVAIKRDMLLGGFKHNDTDMVEGKSAPPAEGCCLWASPHGTGRAGPRTAFLTNGGR